MGKGPWPSPGGLLSPECKGDVGPAPGGPALLEPADGVLLGGPMGPGLARTGVTAWGDAC